ncbi:NACHT domain-containing protein [Nonomuraea sp. NPDC004702]
MLIVVVGGSLPWVSWSGADSRAHPLDFISVLLAALGLVGTAAGLWAAARPSPGHLAVADVKSAAGVLAERVEQQWREESRYRQVHEPRPMPVRWRRTTNPALMSPLHLAAPSGAAFDGRGDDIAALAQRFRRRGRLVITGGAGTGKTTLAVQLLLHLLATRHDNHASTGDRGALVPVLLPASGWDTDTHDTLQKWLAERLEQDYPALKAPQLGPGAAAALANSGRILPILDGLDEISDDRRVRVLTALNKSLGEHGHIIVTSRTAEFRATVDQVGRPLAGAEVIAARALSRQDAADYLSDCLSGSPPAAWKRVLRALRGHAVPGLAELTLTPLGLWLIRAVYLDAHADPSPLLGPLGQDAAALRAHLLDRLIPAVIAAQPPSANPADFFRPRRVWDPDKARRYLTYLARAFPPAATRDIAWWNIARTIADSRSSVGCASRILFRVLFVRSWAKETPGYANLRLLGRTRALRRAVTGDLDLAVKFGPVGAVVAVLLGGRILRPGQEIGLLYGAVMGYGIMFTIVFVITLIAGLNNWAEQPTPSSMSTPRSSWEADRALALVRMAMSGSVVGLTFGLLLGLMFGPRLGFVIAGLMSGLAGALCGLIIGLFEGRHHAWQAFSLALIWLTLRHQLPWRLMDFLDDAHRLGLLRALGPIYQFRHAALHDHLAAAPLEEAGRGRQAGAREPRG